MPDLVLSERRGAVALLTLNRPDALNALSSALLADLGARIDAVARDGSARALVLTGAGRAFAAGADIAQMRSMTALEGEAFSRLGHDTLAKLEALPIPTLAAVNGFALGGGCELALACDWIYAAKRARLGQPEVNLGLLPGFGGTSRLTRRVGVAWAKELVLTGEPIDAETAQRIGLVNRVFDDIEPLLAAALAAGETIAKKGPVAIARREARDARGAGCRRARRARARAGGVRRDLRDRGSRRGHGRLPRQARREVLREVGGGVGRVLLTGAAGFIGAQTAGLLLDEGREVVGLDDLNDAYDPRVKRARLAGLASRASFSFVRADIADRAALAAAVPAGAFDAVINLAARAGVRTSVETRGSTSTRT